MSAYPSTIAPLTLRSGALAAASLAACVHTVPLKVGPDDGLVVSTEAPVATRAPAGEPLAVAPDWTLVVDLKDGRRSTFDGPLAVSHAAGALSVVRTPVATYSAPPAEAWRFEDQSVRGAHLEHTDPAGTALIVTGLTVLVAGGIFGMVQLFTIGEQ